MSCRLSWRECQVVNVVSGTHLGAVSAEDWSAEIVEVIVVCCVFEKVCSADRRRLSVLAWWRPSSLPSQKWLLQRKVGRLRWKRLPRWWPASWRCRWLTTPLNSVWQYCLPCHPLQSDFHWPTGHRCDPFGSNNICQRIDPSAWASMKFLMPKATTHVAVGLFLSWRSCNNFSSTFMHPAVRAKPICPYACESFLGTMSVLCAGKLWSEGLSPVFCWLPPLSFFSHDSVVIGDSRSCSHLAQVFGHLLGGRCQWFDLHSCVFRNLGLATFSRQRFLDGVDKCYACGEPETGVNIGHDVQRSSVCGTWPRCLDVSLALYVSEDQVWTKTRCSLPSATNLLLDRRDALEHVLLVSRLLVRYDDDPYWWRMNTGIDHHRGANCSQDTRRWRL